MGLRQHGTATILRPNKEEVLDGLTPDQLASVIERAQQLEPEAYDALVDAYGQRLFGFLFRMTRSREDAEDLLQDVFLRVVRMLPGYAHAGRFESWLFRIAANLARDRIRRVRRSPKIVSLSPGTDDSGESGWECADPSSIEVDQSLVLREQTDRLNAALVDIPAAEREVIMLRHYSGLSFAEIAEVMETPLGTALARAHRGLAKLRRIMESGDGE